MSLMMPLCFALRCLIAIPRFMPSFLLWNGMVCTTSMTDDFSNGVAVLSTVQEYCTTRDLGSRCPLFYDLVNLTRVEQPNLWSTPWAIFPLVTKCLDEKLRNAMANN